LRYKKDNMSAPVVTFSKKTINKEIARIVALAKETDFLFSGVAALDESGKNDIPEEVLTQIGKKVLEKVPQLSLLLISAGSTCCTVLACVAPDKQNDVSATDWMIAAGVSDSSFGGQDMACGVFTCDCPLKSKEEVAARAFAFARSSNLLVEDESSEEMIAYDLYE